MKKDDFILFICYILIIIGLLIFTYHQYKTEVNECTRDPIKYGVESIRENYDADYVYGDIYFIVGKDTHSWRFGDEFNILNLSE